MNLRNPYYLADPPIPRVAAFDARNHCTDDGWATWMRSPMFRFRVRCWLGRHAWPLYTPYPADGSSPSNYDRCTRCHAFVHWFVDGQHHYGSLSRYFADLDVGETEEGE